jgi:hypothetical protein
LVDFSKIAASVLDTAEKFAPLLEGTPVGAVVLAGKSILDLIDNVKEVASSDDAAALSAKRDELEPLVLAHIDRTMDELG